MCQAAFCHADARKKEQHTIWKRKDSYSYCDGISSAQKDNFSAVSSEES